MSVRQIALERLAELAVPIVPPAGTTRNTSPGGGVKREAYARLTELAPTERVFPQRDAGLVPCSTVPPPKARNMEQGGLVAADRQPSGGTSAGTPVSDLASAWFDALASLDASRAPIGIDPDHWRALLADAVWLCDRHGLAAHRLGWDASALFGIGPRPGWGGLADRLEGCRHLILTDRIAHWRGAVLEGWLWRETMRPMRTPWGAAEFLDTIKKGAGRNG